MPDLSDRRSLPRSYVLAECLSASLTIRATAQHLEALASHLPLLAQELRGVIEVTAKDHLRQAAERLESAVWSEVGS